MQGGETYYTIPKNSNVVDPRKPMYSQHWTESAMMPAWRKPRIRKTGMMTWMGSIFDLGPQGGTQK